MSTDLHRSSRRRRNRRLRRLLLYPLSTVLLLFVCLVVVYFATLYTPGVPHEGHLALRGATVLVGPDLEPQVGTTVLVRDGVIVEVGPDADIEVPTDATVFDLAGHTMLPGLIDLHVHLGMPELDRGQEVRPARFAGLLMDAMRYVPAARRAYLEHGVTTVRSLGDEHAWVTELRQMVDDGELEGPACSSPDQCSPLPAGTRSSPSGSTPHRSWSVCPPPPQQRAMLSANSQPVMPPWT